jgi:hypothetical protein
VSRYKERLRDPRWQKVRLRIFERDGFACRRCGRGDEELHAHHIVYRHGFEPWEYEHEEILTLCNSCHEVEHREGDDAWRIVRSVAAHRGALGGNVYGLADAFAAAPNMTDPEWAGLYSCIAILLRMRRDGKNLRDLARQLDDLSRDWDAGRDDEGFDAWVLANQRGAA